MNRAVPTMRQRLAYGGIFVLAVLIGWKVTSHWDGLQLVNRSAACAIGALLIVLLQFLATRPEAILRRFLLTAVLVAWCGASLGWNLVGPLAQLPSGKSLHIWSFFHYYLGTKYFPELGYTDLYEQALAADAEGAHDWSYIKRVRSLETYSVEPVDQPARSLYWSDDRWRAFQSDLAFFEAYLSRRNWSNIFRDRGYNAPPPSTAMRRAFMWFDLSPRSLAVVGALDIILLLAAFIAVGRVFGPLRALVSLTWIALFFGNIGNRLVGQPFLYDYLAALLFAACALKRDHAVLSGALLAYAAVMRVFPGLLIIGLVWWAILDWRRTRKVPRPAVHFILAFASMSTVLCALGLGNGRGVEGWKEFTSNVTHHAQKHVFGERRLGLAHVFTVDWSKPPVGRQGESERSETWLVQKGAWRVLATGLCVLWLWATSRNRLDMFDTLVSALVLVFCLVVLSRYYWSSACLLFLIGGGKREGPMGRAGPTSIGAALLAWSSAVYAYSIFQDEKLARYLFANLAAVALIVVWMSLMIYRTRRQRL